MTDTPPPFPSLAAVGLNLQAIFDLKQLPAAVRDTLGLEAAADTSYTQLLLIGHRGRLLWQTVQARGLAGADPLDDFSRAQVVQLFEGGGPLAGHRYRLLFPSTQPLALQQLGALAGWHHDSPLRVGINAAWGTWFAYRALVVANTAWPLTPPQTGTSPCTDCQGQPCLRACPAGALAPSFNLKACLSHRKQPDSSCEDRCLARNACPVRPEHRYTEAQTRYHYLQSMPMIRQFF